MLVSTSAPHPDFWRGKRVLLTGHSGFKGAWLALWLQRLGAQVTGRSDMGDTARLGQHARLAGLS